MRTITAVLTASLLLAGAGWAGQLTPMPPRLDGSAVLQISQLKTMFPKSATPMQVVRSGITQDNAPTTTQSTTSKDGNTAYKTGSGVALTAPTMRDAATGSSVNLYHCIYSSFGLGTVPNGGVQLWFPNLIPQNPGPPLLTADFGQLPQSKHLYLLTLRAIGPKLADNLKVTIGGQQVSPSDIKVNGNTVGIMFVYDAASNDPVYAGFVSVDVGWTGNGSTQNTQIYFYFYSLQLMQLD